MENLKTVKEIKKEFERKVKENEKTKKIIIGEKVTEHIMKAIQLNSYAVEIELPYECSISEFTEIANNMDASILRHKNKYYICMDKKPNIYSIKNLFKLNYEINGYCFLGLTILFLLFLFIFSLTKSVNNYEIAYSRFFEYGVILSIFFMLKSFIELKILNKKTLELKDNIYLLKTRFFK